MDIRVLDSNFIPVGIIDTYTSLVINRKWYGVGETQLVIASSLFDMSLLSEDYIYYVDEKRAFYIANFNRDLEKNGEVTTVKFTALKGITKNRLIIPPAGQAELSLTGKTETVMKGIVSNDFKNSPNANRNIASLIIASDNLKGVDTTATARYTYTADKLEELAKYADLGWDIYLDLANKKYSFDVHTGNDLSATQNVLPPAIFSTEFDNVNTKKLTIDFSNHKNVGVVGGAGDGASRLIATVFDGAEPSGLNRKEVFIDANDVITNTGGELTQRGLQKLVEYKKSEAFDVTILPINLSYDIDFAFGDIVTIIDGSTVYNKRIIEVNEVYESGGFRLDAIFGDDILTLQQKIKRDFKNIAV